MKFCSLKIALNHELADRTGQPLDKIQADTDRDFFYVSTTGNGIRLDR